MSHKWKLVHTQAIFQELGKDFSSNKEYMLGTVYL